MHIDPDITNTLEPRTNWAICMGPMGNLQGSYKFLSLATGKKVTRRKFTEMPVTDAVIKQVEEMAVKDEAIKGINFKDRKGLEYEFNNDKEYEMLVFEKLKPLTPHVALNTTAAREHVGEIERKIRVIKERARGTFNTLPYKKLPKMMVIELLHFCVMWMICFPREVRRHLRKMKPMGVGIPHQAGC
jgi:hypothetical protein